MPSTTSSSVSVPFASSTDTTPSAPTRSIAAATNSPIASIACARSWRSHLLGACGFGFARSRKAAIAARDPTSKPRLSSIALAPATRCAPPLLQPVAEQRGGGGAVAHGIAGASCRLPQHLYTEILDRVL